MSAADPGSSRIAPPAAALARQRAALIARDPLALQASSEAVIEILGELHASGPLAGPDEIEAVAAAHVALRANADVLSRAIAINTRALSVLFEPPPTYGRAGAPNAPRMPRKLESA